MTDNIVIIGAGVIGASCAMALQKEGHKVTLVDHQEPCAGASFGNAGAIVNSSCVPIAMPGIVLDTLKMFGKPLSPLSIRPEYFHKIAPWLFRLILQSRATAVTKNATHLHALTNRAVESWRQLTHNTNLTSLLKDSGWLKVYEQEENFNSTSKARALMDKMGAKYEVLSAAQIHELEPNLASIFKVGILQKDCLRITNPQRLVQKMVDLFVAHGGKYKQFSVEKLRLESGQINLSGATGELVADKVIVAAGAWSRSLAKQLGDNVPLDTERGYHLMMPESTSNLLNGPVVNGDSFFALSPMETGMRMTSQVEFAGLSGKANYSHVRSLLPVAKRMLPKIHAHEESVWMGFRPSLPDSLPVLGFSSKSDKVLYAFGHQHLGMTMAAISGLVMADLLAGRKPVVNVSPYSPQRF